MHWIVASLLSAFFLGCYELLTKHAVKENAVLPVLFFSNTCGALVWIGLMTFDHTSPGALPVMLKVAPLDCPRHLLLLFKSLIVGSAWVCTYFAVKHLPVSIASPIRAMSPVLTCVGALVVLMEKPSLLELLGIGTTILSFVGLSLAGREEGIHFLKNKWISWLALGTFFNGCSALYDKFLLGNVGFTPATVQAWFSIYLMLLFLPLVVGC
jgi:drug/metabolite transporter (DMT)-like permease